MQEGGFPISDGDTRRDRLSTFVCVCSCAKKEMGGGVQGFVDECQLCTTSEERALCVVPHRHETRHSRTSWGQVLLSVTLVQLHGSQAPEKQRKD